ncbi:MAG: DMT family transporter [Desulfosarcina sp.]
MKATAAARSDRLLAGALHVLGASLMFAMMGALVKTATAELPNVVVVFFRNFLALVILMPFFLQTPGLAALKTRHFPRHLARSLTGLGSMYLFFYTLERLPLAESVLLAYTSPLFIPLVARVWIGEPLSRVVYWAVFLGFGGVVLILRPGPGVLRPAALMGLGSGILMAVAMVSIRRMSDTEPPGRIVFYFSLLATVVSALPLLWNWQTPSPWAMAILVGIALLAVLGQMLLTRGYSLAPAGRIGPFSYANIIFAALLGWIFWSETLTLFTGLGILLVCGAGMLVVAHGHRQTGVPVPSVPGNLHTIGQEKEKKRHTRSV